MINKQLIFIGLFCVGSQLHSEVNNNSNIETTVDFSQGYRRDKLDVTVSKNNQQPTFKAKNRYTSIDVYTSRLAMTLRKNDFFLKGLAGYGNVCQGKFRSQEHINNRYTEFSSNYKASKDLTGDYTADFALTFGKDFSLESGWTISPTIGYGVYIQDFHTNHGKFCIRTSDYENRHGKSNKRRYKATWYSPQLGLNIRKSISETLSGCFNYSFLFPLSYQASGYANGSMKKYSHFEDENKAYKSFGNLATIGLNWNFATNWSLKPEIELMKFYSKGGDSGHIDHLKSVHRTAAEYRVVLGYVF